MSSHRPRRGLTLLEVLISIGVLMIGLASVVALIPIGARAISQTARADRASACARAASHDVLVRGMMDRTGWYYADGTTAFDTPTTPPTYALAQPLLGQPLVIDPLQIVVGLQAGIGAPALDRFPYSASGSCPILHRLNVAQVTAANAMLYQRLFSRIFTWPDDQLFDMPEERDKRPRQFFTMVDGSFNSQGNPPGTPPPPYFAVRQSDGNYSWLITAMPSADDTPPEVFVGGVWQPNTAALQLDHQRTYTVSVAVFYKRDLDLTAPQPPERWVELRHPTATGGHTFSPLGPMVGDVMLAVPASRTADYRAEYLDVKQNQWILLCAQKNDARLPGGVRTIAKWYRVVAADEPVAKEMRPINGGSNVWYWTRYVTLAGPDWDSAAGYVPVPQRLTVCAILLDGVIDVHTTTVEVGQ